MAILLQNLLARAPKINDLESVTNLLITCDSAEDDVAIGRQSDPMLPQSIFMDPTERNAMSDYTEEQVRSNWQKNGFDLECDAWVIVTYRGEFVGYASLCADEDGHIEMIIRVHPRYQKRGIGTLLLRLAEQRARHLISKMSSGMRVTLQSTVSSINSTARQLLEYEGYTALYSFWRITIDREESLDEFSQQGILTLDVSGRRPNLAGIAQIHKRTGIYVMRQYDVYEKVLRMGSEDNWTSVINTAAMEPVEV